MSEVPSIRIIEAINPANSGTGESVLIYDNLSVAVNEYKTTNTQRSEEVWDAERSSLEELSKARQLALEYLLRTSEKVITSGEGNRDLWADRFTQAAVELYGEPERSEASRLLVCEFEFLSQLTDRDDVSKLSVQFLLDTYTPIIRDYRIENDQQEVQTDEERESQAVAEYGEAIRAKYQPLFDLVDMSGKTEFMPSDLEELFTQALDWLKENDDPEWGQWAVVPKDGTSLSVNASDREVKIATRREAASVKDAKDLIAHELLVHALRAKNGYKTGDDQLATGLPDSLTVEEGLGIVAETAIDGELSGDISDDYIDIALALGVIDGTQRNRHELFKISYARQLLRIQVKGPTEELDTLAPRVWSHIDRIYRGGPGDNLGTRQAVFTKDIAYYVGYKQMAAYITRQLDEGRSANQVFDYLSQGKFDPNNELHVKRLADLQK